MYKKCSTCKEEKLFGEFVKCKSRKDGLDNRCKSCVKEYKLVNKEKLAKYQKKYMENYYSEYYENNKQKLAEKYLENRQEILEKRSEYYKLNSEKKREYNKLYGKLKKLSIFLYKQANKARTNAISAKRRAIKLNATPDWLTKEQLLEIQEFYEVAQAFKLYTGQEYHVDHIVPLQGKNVCGLHVPWNLQILEASENISKSNKLLED